MKCINKMIFTVLWPSLFCCEMFGDFFSCSQVCENEFFSLLPGGEICSGRKLSQNRWHSAHCLAFTGNTDVWMLHIVWILYSNNPVIPCKKNKTGFCCFICVTCCLCLRIGREGRLHFRVWDGRPASKNKSHYLPDYGRPAGVRENLQRQRLQIRGGRHRPAPHSPTVRNKSWHISISLTSTYFTFVLHYYTFICYQREMGKCPGKLC